MKKIASVGMLSKVTLYELQVEYGNQRWWLDNLHATVTQDGMKQVVQGWVIKTNQDRRELYLHVPGAFVATFNLQHSAVTPAQLMDFAEAINIMVAKVPEMRRGYQTRVNAVKLALAMALGDTSRLTQKADALDSVRVSAMQQTTSTVAATQGLIARVDVTDRRVRKLQQHMTQSETQLAGVIDGARQEVERTRAFVATADAEARTLVGEVSFDNTSGHGPQSLDMWLTKVSDKLHEIGFVETTRWTDETFGGEKVSASISLTQPTGRVFVLLFVSVADATRACGSGLPDGLTKAVQQGITALTTRGRVVIMAHNPYGVRTDALEHWANITSEIELPSTAEVAPPPVGEEASAASSPPAQLRQTPDPLDALRKLGELRDAGILTPEEFEAKKTELLKRV